MTVEIKKETIRQRQKRETRTLILKAARTLFTSSGFADTTIRAIASEAGIGLGTVFNYFPDKTSLLIAALIDDLGKIQMEAMHSYPKHGSFLDKFLHFSEQYFRYYAANIPLSRILLKEMLFVEGECVNILKEQYSQYLTLLTVFLKEDDDVYRYEYNGDAHLLAECLFSNYYFVLLAGLSSDSFDVELQIAKLKQMTSITLQTYFATNGVCRQ